MPKNTTIRPAILLPDGTFEIQLTQGYVTIVDAEDADLALFNWHLQKPENESGYARRNPTAKTHEHLHRVILERIIGRKLIESELTDHIDGNGLNNRRSNLRLATRKQNNYNKKISKNSKSGHKGVTWNKQRKKWKAQIVVNGKYFWLGYFDNPEEAHRAYCVAAEKYFGEFANKG